MTYMACLLLGHSSIIPVRTELLCFFLVGWEWGLNELASLPKTKCTVCSVRGRIGSPAITRLLPFSALCVMSMDILIVKR